MAEDSKPKRPDWIFASDIDYTLTGDPAALQRLTQQLTQQRAAGRLFLILSTGRRLADILPGFDEEDLPRPDAIVSQVGTEIFLPPFTPAMQPLPAWEQRQRQAYRRERAEAFLEDIEGLEMQARAYNTPLKVSAFLHETPDPDAAARKIQRRVAHAPDGAGYQVVYSSGMHLDIIPAVAGKGNAIRFVLAQCNLPADNVIVAGDSGNDRSMFDSFSQGIIVANAQPELKEVAAAGDSQHYLAQAPYAAGVLEGLRHFGRL